MQAHFRSQMGAVVLRTGIVALMFPSFSWAVLSHVMSLDQSLASENI